MNRIVFMRVPTTATHTAHDGTTITVGDTTDHPCKAFITHDDTTGHSTLHLYTQPNPVAPINHHLQTVLNEPWTGPFDTLPQTINTADGPVTLTTGPGCACTYPIKTWRPPTTTPPPITPPDPGGHIRYRVTTINPRTVHSGPYKTRAEAQTHIDTHGPANAIIEATYLTQPTDTDDTTPTPAHR